MVISEVEAPVDPPATSRLWLAAKYYISYCPESHLVIQAVDVE
jgi:hypothetical protein